MSTKSRGILFLTLATWFLVLTVGTFDQEDLYHSVYSIGGFYGPALSRSWDFSLTKTLWGIPVIDLGLVGGFRLPFQSSFGSGFLWPLREILSSTAIAILYVLCAMLVAAVSYSRFAESWTPVVTEGKQRWTFGIAKYAAWLIFLYPVLEYLLQEDWYSHVVPYCGFIAISASLSRKDLRDSSLVRLTDVREVVRTVLIGVYLVFLGHASLLRLYFWLPALLLVWHAPSVIRVLRGRLRLAKIEILLFAVVILRVGTVLVDVLSEYRERPRSGTSPDWWVSPLRGPGDFKHFLGQVLVSENSWLLRFLAPDLLQKFNLPSPGLGRLPLSLLLLLFLVGLTEMVLLRSKNRAWCLSVLALQLLVFSSMVGALRVLSAGSDYLWRDTMIVGVGIASLTTLSALEDASQSESILPKSLVRALFVGLLSYYAVTTVVAPRTVMAGRSDEELPSLSPKSVFGSTTNNREWQLLADSLRAEGASTVAFINLKIPYFSDSDTAIGVGGYEGLTGWHQLRQVGIRSLEGFPKMRSTKHLNGSTGFQSRLTFPTDAICHKTTALLLQIDTIVARSHEVASCLSQLEEGGTDAREPRLRVDISDLPGTELRVIHLRSRFWITVDPPPKAGSLTECGIVTDVNCLSRAGQLGLIPIADNEIKCDGRCLDTLDFRSVSSDRSDSRIVLLPISGDIPTRVISSDGDLIATRDINGFVGLPIVAVAGKELRVEWYPDFRILLQAFSGWSQMLFAPTILVRAARRMSGKRSRTLIRVLKQGGTKLR